LAKRKKKPVETIKLEGLSQDTIKEFAPKDNPQKEDKLWEEYFLGNPKILNFPVKESMGALPSLEKNQQEKNNTVDMGSAISDPTAVTRVTIPTEATTVTDVTTDQKPKKTKETKYQYITLDSTHTKSEQFVYSIMYRETISKGREEHYFSLRKLMKMTGIGSDKTVFNALKGLMNKFSIALIEHSNNKPVGTLYKVFSPKEVFKLRKEKNILIDIKTKRIVITAVTEATAVDRTAIPTTVRTTAATSVESTAVKEDTPYIKENKDINNDDSIRNIESSSEDETFDHKKSIISLYKKYTENTWSDADHRSYQTIKNIIPDIIEAALIASVMRSKNKVNSFAYCKGAIQEFTQNLEPGDLMYLRDKWQELKNTGAKEKPKKRDKKDI